MNVQDFTDQQQEPRAERDRFTALAWGRAVLCRLDQNVCDRKTELQLQISNKGRAACVPNNLPGFRTARTRTSRTGDHQQLIPGPDLFPHKTMNHERADGHEQATVSHPTASPIDSRPLEGQSAGFESEEIRPIKKLILSSRARSQNNSMIPHRSCLEE